MFVKSCELSVVVLILISVVILVGTIRRRVCPSSGCYGHDWFDPHMIGLNLEK